MSNPKNKTIKPCGCIITEMDDDTVQMSPCVPCGIMEAARALGSIGQILAAVATRIQHEQSSKVVQDAAKKVAEQ